MPERLEGIGCRDLGNWMEKVFRGSAELRIMNNEENEKQKWKKVI